MAIRFNEVDVKYKLKNKRKIVSWIKEIVALHNKSVGEISIVFTNDENILKINNQFLKHNYFTDIITFDYSNMNKLEGDIFVSIDTVLSNSKIFNTTFDDEILRVIIHGVLHLVGFKDKNKFDKLEMTRNENIALEIFFKDNG